jgi:EpsI family protein
MIGAFAYHGITGPDGDVHGPFSLARTTLISAIGFLILFWLISRFSDAPVATAKTEPRDHERWPDVSMSGRTVGLGFALAAAFFASTAAFDHWNEAASVPLATDLAQFPRVVARWRAVGEPLASAPADAVRFDNSLSRRYAAPDGTQLDLLLGYFERQRPVHELVGFEVSRLLSRRENVTPRLLTRDVRVTDFVTVVNGEPYHVTYWYVLNGQILSGDYEAKWWSTWNALTKRRSNGAIVIVKTKLGDSRSIEAARSTTRDFVEQLVEVSGRLLSS